MHITKMAFALALAVPASLPAGPAAPSSPLGYEPAVVRYVTNDAPFVVFDVSPRSVTGPPKDLRDIQLNFIATDTLQKVNVFPYAMSSRDGTTQVAAGVECGGRDAGYWSCTIPAQDLLARMADGEGLFGLRIEADGLQREHSTVVITLPVKIATAKHPASPSKATPPGSRDRSAGFTAYAP